MKRIGGIKRVYRYFGPERRARNRNSGPGTEVVWAGQAGDVEKRGTGTVNFGAAQAHRFRSGSGDVVENGLWSRAGRGDGWRSPAQAPPGKAAADRRGVRQRRDHPHATAAVGADTYIDAKDSRQQFRPRQPMAPRGRMGVAAAVFGLIRPCCRPRSFAPTRVAACSEKPRDEKHSRPERTPASGSTSRRRRRCPARSPVATWPRIEAEVTAATRDRPRHRRAGPATSPPLWSTRLSISTTTSRCRPPLA